MATQAVPQATVQQHSAVDLECDPVLPQEPYLEMRELGLYCRLCWKVATAKQFENSKVNVHIPKTNHIWTENNLDN